MYKLKVGAVIVAYYPEFSLLFKNISIIKNSVDKIVIVNNTPENIDNVFDANNIVIINNKRNFGIASALNTGVKYFKKCRFDFVILFDQDSTPDINMIDNLVECHRNNDGAYMIVPTIHYIGKKCLPTDSADKNNVKFAITSGSCINLKIHNEHIAFDEDLFIDSVDFEFCLSVRKYGYKILQSGRAILYQRLGCLKIYSFMGAEIWVTNHNYIRQYYITRNRLIVVGRYWRFDKSFCYKSIARILINFILIIIFEKDKIRKMKYSIMGARDYLRNKVGEFSFHEN